MPQPQLTWPSDTSPGKCYDWTLGREKVKWTDNVFYNRPGNAYSYEVTTGCGACKTVGWK